MGRNSGVHSRDHARELQHKNMEQGGPRFFWRVTSWSTPFAAQEASSGMERSFLLQGRLVDRVIRGGSKAEGKSR